MQIKWIICNKKQRGNKEKCRCECKELIDKVVCSSTITKNNNETKLVNIAIAENNNETKLVNITIGENENSHCNSCKVYIALLIVAIVISTGVTIYFIYYNRFLTKNNISCTKSNTLKETIIW